MLAALGINSSYNPANPLATRTVTDRPYTRNVWVSYCYILCASGFVGQGKWSQRSQTETANRGFRRIFWHLTAHGKHLTSGFGKRVFYVPVYEYTEEEEALLLQRDCMMHMLVEILQLQIIPFETNCNQKVTIQYIHSKSSQLQLWNNPYITSC